MIINRENRLINIILLYLLYHEVQYSIKKATINLVINNNRINISGKYI